MKTVRRRNALQSIGGRLLFDNPWSPAPLGRALPGAGRRLVLAPGRGLGIGRDAGTE